MAGLATTFAVLGRTENDAATPLLLEALDAPSSTVRAAAARAILERRSSVGMRVLVDRVDRWEDGIVHAAGDFHGRLVPTLREALLDEELDRATIGCRASVRFREYEIIPTLIGVVEEAGRERADAAAQALVQIADELVRELAAIRDERLRRDPTLARQHAVTALEQSLQRYPQHRRQETIEAFLQLTTRENAALHRILTDPRDPCFAPVVEVLSTSQRAGVVRLLLSWLDDPRPPTAALQTVFRRSDRRTIDAVLKKIGAEPTAAVRANLRRLDFIAWLDEAVLSELDDAAQQAAVAATSASGLKLERMLEVYESMMRVGGVGARRAVVAALAETRGTRAATLVLRSLQDAAPVRAAALLQLRGRGIPGALAELLTSLDSDSAEEREAARSQLQEFSFRRFLPAFELLDDAVRRSTGRLVAKIDLTSTDQLREELQSSQTKRRVRALEMAGAMDQVDALQDELTVCVGDDEQAVRIEAARTLASARGDWADGVLRALLEDEAFAVRETASDSLARRSSTAARNEVADGR